MCRDGEGGNGLNGEYGLVRCVFRRVQTCKDGAKPSLRQGFSFTKPETPCLSFGIWGASYASSENGEQKGQPLQIDSLTLNHTIETAVEYIDLALKSGRVKRAVAPEQTFLMVAYELQKPSFVRKE